MMVPLITEPFGCLHKELCMCYGRGLIASEGYMRGYAQGMQDARSHLDQGPAGPPNEDGEVEETEEEEEAEDEEDLVSIEYEDAEVEESEQETDLESLGDADLGGDDDDDDDDHSEYHDAPEDRLDGVEDGAEAPERQPSSKGTPPPPSSSDPPPPPSTSSGTPPAPPRDLPLATPPTTSSSLAAASTPVKPKKKSEDIWQWLDKMALGKHLRNVMDEDVDGIANTERKWHVISSRMRNIDKFNKSWYGVKNKWNRWGRAFFGIDERVRRRTDSMTTGIRNKPAPKIKASERTDTQEPSAEAPYQPCTCGAPDAANGGMIACDGEHQLTSWFHYECIGLTDKTLPNGNWFCPECMGVGFSDDADGEDYDEGDEEKYRELPLALPDHAPKPKRKRDDKDDFDDEYGPDATENTSDTITLQSTKRIRV
ncbi:hypothetical protein MMC17_003418 [Xylographa soralifera]|nr:hypothetical protein [Xylographa soralifera]